MSGYDWPLDEVTLKDWFVNEGLTFKAIAERIGGTVTRSAVAGLCKRRGLTAGLRGGGGGDISTKQQRDPHGSGGCRWVDGDPLITEWSFCQKPTIRPNAPYCSHHHERAYRPLRQETILRQ